MELKIDDDVKAVAEFMQGNVAAARLVPVASAVAALAPILWEQHEAEDVTALRLVPSPLNGDQDLLPQQAAKAPLPERAGVDDGFAVEAS